MDSNYWYLNWIILSKKNCMENAYSFKDYIIIIISY